MYDNDEKYETEMTAKKITKYIILALLACGIIYLIFTPVFWKQMHWLIPAITIICGLAIPVLFTVQDTEGYIGRAIIAGIFPFFGMIIRSGIIFFTTDTKTTFHSELIFWIITFALGFAYGVIIPFVMAKHNLEPEDMPELIDKAISSFCKSSYLKLCQVISRKPKAKPQ